VKELFGGIRVIMIEQLSMPHCVLFSLAEENQAQSHRPTLAAQR
jgi:hypothetical protein